MKENIIQPFNESIFVELFSQFNVIYTQPMMIHLIMRLFIYYWDKLMNKIMNYRKINHKFIQNIHILEIWFLICRYILKSY